ncbi:MAG: DUF1566 domain-containing protein [Sulfurovaceae bacterium]|nr:DUF1566 domain-containing protein [Sulfurovaceae bacterium]
MRQIFLMISVSMILFATFSRDNLGVVTDSRTNLVWQDSYKNNDGVINRTTWEDALIYCQELRLTNNSDWRLPNMIELKSIKEINRLKPSINLIFKNTVSSHYWSSTTPSSNTTDAWMVNFFNGHGSWKNKKNSSLVRCVRGGL